MKKSITNGLIAFSSLVFAQIVFIIWIVLAATGEFAAIAAPLILDILVATTMVIGTLVYSIIFIVQSSKIIKFKTLIRATGIVGCVISGCGIFSFFLIFLIPFLPIIITFGMIAIFILAIICKVKLNKNNDEKVIQQNDQIQSQENAMKLQDKE